MLRPPRPYIIYRKKEAKEDTTKRLPSSVDKTISEYLNRQDSGVNAVQTKISLGGLILNTSGKVTANYWLSHIRLMLAPLTETAITTSTIWICFPAIAPVGP